MRKFKIISGEICVIRGEFIGDKEVFGGSCMIKDDEVFFKNSAFLHGANLGDIVVLGFMEEKFKVCDYFVNFSSPCTNLPQNFIRHFFVFSFLCIVALILAIYFFTTFRYAFGAFFCSIFLILFFIQIFDLKPAIKIWKMSKFISDKFQLD